MPSPVTERKPSEMTCKHLWTEAKLNSQTGKMLLIQTCRICGLDRIVNERTD